jgi:predicted O-linked N-acetylglucosamine transferase (SPINDLY family)
VRDPRLLLKKGIDLEADGYSAQAAVCLEEALAIEPSMAQAHYHLGLLLSRQGDFGRSIRAQLRALATDPALAEACTNLGYSYYSQGRHDDAVSAYRKAVTIKPGYARAHYNMGIAFMAQRRFSEAVGSLRRALIFDPLLAEAHLCAGNILNLFLADQHAALPYYQNALAARPGAAEVHFALGDTLLKLARPEDAAASYRHAVTANPTLAAAYSNLILVLQYRTHLTEEVSEVLESFRAQFEAPLEPAWPRHENSRDPERRLKIGYVSPDLHNHSVSHFVAPVLTRHDQQAVEIYCYYNNDRQDEVTDRIRRGVDHWIPCKQLSDSALAERIRADGIDILVDLTGHTGSNRLLTFARKPAPIQISWIGYPGTTGLKAMDYVLTDPYLDPVGMTDRHYTEKLFRLSPNSFIFEPPIESPPVNELPALGSRSFTFACLNNLAKVSDEIIALWSRVLAAVPHARLVIGNGPDAAIRRRFTEGFTRAGVGPERLVLLPRLSLGNFLLSHHQIDLALDTFPYNGGTTSCHSLWMGVPVLTLAGDTTASRQGAAMLGWAGLDGFITTSGDEYASRAVEIAGNLDELSRIRRSLREHIARNNDASSFTRRLENAYRSMWQRWCSAKTG